MPKQNIYVELLQHARSIINNEETQFVCVAVSIAVQRHYFYQQRPAAAQAAYEIINRIDASLTTDGKDASPSVVAWLVESGVVPSYRREEYGIGGVFKQYRLRWIDWMIEGYQRAARRAGDWADIHIC